MTDKLEEQFGVIPMNILKGVTDADGDGWDISRLKTLTVSDYALDEAVSMAAYRHTHRELKKAEAQVLERLKVEVPELFGKSGIKGLNDVIKDRTAWGGENGNPHGVLPLK